jgi:hypothetical protein
LIDEGAIRRATTRNAAPRRARDARDGVVRARRRARRAAV